MLGNLRIRPLALAALLFVGGCSRFPQETLDSVVLTELYDVDGHTAGLATGLVFKHDGRFTYILTAYHTTRVFMTQQVGPLPFMTIQYSVPGRPVAVIKGKRYDGEVVWGDEGRDAALFRIDRVDVPPVDIYEGDLDYDEEAVCAGRLVLITSHPVHQRGRFMGWDDAGTRQIFNTHSQRGCSGGGIFVFRRMRWRVAALAVAIGSQNDGTLLHHAVWAVPIRTITEALDSGKSKKDPLPLDLLREF